MSFSKPSPRSKSWENGVPRIGLRIGYKNVTTNELGFKAWSSSHERQQSGSWLPGVACELTSVPGCDLRGGGSAHHIAQNHQINTPHRVAHRISHYCSRLVVGRGPYTQAPFFPLYPALVPPLSAHRRRMSESLFVLCPFRSRLHDLNPGKTVSRV